jgi:hypothetical protein
MKSTRKFALAAAFLLALTFTVAPRTAAAKGVDIHDIPIIHHVDSSSPAVCVAGDVDRPSPAARVALYLAAALRLIA